MINAEFTEEEKDLLINLLQREIVSAQFGIEQWKEYQGYDTRDMDRDQRDWVADMQYVPNMEKKCASCKTMLEKLNEANKT